MDCIVMCRTCLSNEVHKDISELQAYENEACSDIIFFCLNIKVEKDSKISTKLCLKCYKKIISFYQFKSLALKNDAYLKSESVTLLVKNEIFLRDEIKLEDVSSCGSVTEEDLIDIKIEADTKDETDGQSDNEFLSVIKKIKYEFIADDPKSETKENAPTKIKRGKRGRRPKDNKSGSVAQVCEECGKLVKNLKEHAVQHLPAAVRKRYPCKLCEKTFATYRARKKHEAIKHLGISLKKPCPICSKMVVSVKAHTLLVHRSGELRHACASCARRFISRSALAAHAVVHTRSRPHACDACEKTFGSKIILLQHKRQVHDKEKSHLCQFCSKSFFKKYHLQVHLRTHTKEKPYQCPECDKSFASSSILNNHRSVHSDVKRFECTLCTMSFARSGYLRAHMLSHTKEKKHPCSYCGVKFLRSDHRRRHEQTAHERHLITNLNSKDATSIFSSNIPTQRITSSKNTESIATDRAQITQIQTFSFNSGNSDSGTSSPQPSIKL